MTLVGLDYLDKQEKARHNLASENLERQRIISSENIAYQDREAKKDIASLDRASREGIASADRISKENIASADRTSKENIALADRESREEVSRYQSDAKIIGDSEILNEAVAAALAVDYLESGKWGTADENSRAKNALRGLADSILTKAENAQVPSRQGGTKIENTSDLLFSLGVISGGKKK